MIELSDVTLVRRTREERVSPVGPRLAQLFGGRKGKRTATVLDRISFSVERGEKLGIIGVNGAGKSTILRVIAGVLEPTSGAVRVDGRVAALIELGAGFDPEASVTDNIVRFGVLLGFRRREIERRIEDILRFAELQNYRDYPVSALSTGMAARLGFAVATDTPSEVLLIDEVLSVGDESFRAKSRTRLDELWRAETTVIIVSHDLPTVRTTCDRVLWIEGGRLRMAGATNDVVDAYLRSVVDAAEAMLAIYRGRPDPS